MEYERIGLRDEKYGLLGIDLPLVRIPVSPGRNASAVVELACRNHVLKQGGIHTARSLDEKILRSMQKKGEDMKVVIVSGISGSGKTTFLKALEDAGFFCVDNFPLFLLQKFLEVYELAGERIARCGFRYRYTGAGVL